MYGCIESWMDGWVGGYWMDGRMDGAECVARTCAAGSVAEVRSLRSDVVRSPIAQG
jgi:hypothetical protein